MGEDRGLGIHGAGGQSGRVNSGFLGSRLVFLVLCPAPPSPGSLQPLYSKSIKLAISLFLVLSTALA